MKRLFSMVAVLSLTIGAGFASLPVQAVPPAPIAASAAPTLGSGLLSKARKNFDCFRTTELYVASPSKGDGGSILVSERAGSPHSRQCA
jgi:hypothetical protein